jgi:hypothetical protein
LLASATAVPAQTGNMPVKWDTSNLDTTLGQLCKQSQSIFTGKISRVTVTNGFVTIGFVDCSSLCGASVAATNQVFFGGTVHGEYGLLDAHSQRAIIFVSPRLTNGLDYELCKWNYPIRLPEIPSTEAMLHVVGGNGGIIRFDERSEQPLIASITHYWKHLRGADRSFEKYATFLIDGQTSAVERIWLDARSDLRLLIRFSDISTLRELRQKGILNEEDQAYLERMLAWKEKGEPITIRDMTPRDDDWTAWIRAIREGTESIQFHTLLEMHDPSRRLWMEEKSILWREDVANLLSSKSPGLRQDAARLLNTINDKRAIPVLIEMLRRGNSLERRVAWNELKVKCGSDILFDPDALPVVREQAVRTVEKWFKNHDK